MTGEGTVAPRPALRRTVRTHVRWRTIVGGSLVALAAGGVLMAHRAADAPPRTRWLVVTDDVEPGERLTEAHLGTAAIDLPDGVEAVSADDADRVVGRAAVHGLGAGSLLDDEDLLERDRFGAGNGVEVTLTLDTERVPPGGLHSGDVVDLLVTDVQGSDAAGTASGGRSTEVLTEAAVVADVGRPGESGLGTAAGVQVVLGVPDDATAALVVDAAVRREVTVVVPAPGTGGS